MSATRAEQRRKRRAERRESPSAEESRYQRKYKGRWKFWVVIIEIAIITALIMYLVNWVLTNY